MADLNPKQKKFIEFYVRDQNATEAAKQAGYSEKTAYAQGSALLKHPEIKSEIDRRLAISQTQLQNATQVTKEKLIAELMPIIFGDIGDVANWDKETLELIPKDEIGKELRKAIQSISATRTPGQFGTKKQVAIKMHDKLKAIELVSKLLGFIVQKNEHTGKDGEPLASPLDEKKFENILLGFIAAGGKKFE